MRSSLLFVLALVACTASDLLGEESRHSPSVGSVAAKTGTISITAAIVDEEIQVRPVPLHAIIVASAHADTFTVRTRQDGTVSISVPVGKYVLRSLTPMLFQGQRYQWNVRVEVEADKVLEVALTNDNAEIEAAPVSSDRPDAAAALFDRLRRSVFRVEAGLFHGSGFLIDSLGGVILTNAHVVEGTKADNLSVVLDAQTHVRAQLLATDALVDIAVLRVHPDHLAGRPRITLQDPSGKPPVVPGERVIAMGYPLNQELAVTAGIVSSVREGAIISDVRINPGNSGGPLVNMSGEAIAINAFNASAMGRSQGISGSVLVVKAGAALEEAATKIQQTTFPPPDLLAVMPTDRLDLGSLKAYAANADSALYHEFANFIVGDFELTIQTPVQIFVAIAEHEDAVAKDRRKREERAGVPESERYSEVRDYREWSDYIGAPTTPVIGIAVSPKIGQSIWWGGPPTFKGDVQAVDVFCNERLSKPIRGGHAPIKIDLDYPGGMKDVADHAFYVFDPEILRPDSSGAPPRVVVTIRDLKNPDDLECLELPVKIVAQAWNEFEDYYREKRPDATFQRAIAKAVTTRETARMAGFMKQDCDWAFGGHARVGY
jgi:S1-C subfamily serine protease